MSTASKALNNSAAGFTLVELLVVVSIMAVLSSIAVVSFRNVTRGGQDGKRQADLKIIQSSLQQYYVDQGYYPKEESMQAAIDIQAQFNSSVGARSGTQASKIYLNELPKESNPGNKYCYQAIPNGCTNNDINSLCSSYNLYAQLQNSSSTTTNCDGVAYNLKVSPP